METHSDKGLTTMRLMGTSPAGWKLAEIEWVKERRQMQAMVRCHTCHGIGVVRRPGAPPPHVTDAPLPPPGHPHVMRCPTCPQGKWVGYQRNSGQVREWVEMEVTVGYPKWADGTVFDSRFQGGCTCGLCGRTILKSRLVPVQGVDTQGRPHGMWVGSDCAKKFLALSVKLREDRFFNAE